MLGGFSQIPKATWPFITEASGKWSRLAYLEKRVIDEACRLLQTSKTPLGNTMYFYRLWYLFGIQWYKRNFHERMMSECLYISDRALLTFYFLLQSWVWERPAMTLTIWSKFGNLKKKYSLIVSSIHHFKFPFSSKIYKGPGTLASSHLLLNGKEDLVLSQGLKAGSVSSFHPLNSNSDRSTVLS